VATLLGTFPVASEFRCATCAAFVSILDCTNISIMYPSCRAPRTIDKKVSKCKDCRSCQSDEVGAGRSSDGGVHGAPPSANLIARRNAARTWRRVRSGLSFQKTIWSLTISSSAFLHE
jgi:hypothetical protein